MKEIFDKDLEQGNKLFIPYIMAGDGGIDQLLPTLEFLDQSGASAIELGIPFSDPVADGPTIQEAGKRALSEGVTLHQVIETLKSGREKIKAPIIFMTYINPIFKYGIESFVSDIVEAGVDGLIIPDLPLEQKELISESLDAHEVALIQLVSLTSSEERKKEIAQASQGFLYAITVNGITGARKNFEVDLQKHFQSLKEASKVPVLAGFGISTTDHVRDMSSIGDGVVVGSKIIDLLQKNERDEIQSLIDARKTK
ncbi:tryptophan synthase subunit alpha [Halalkalibacillus sediminis]|uniref:Tryptophan synthase alpha chain n=2 Tax=Halalkalibacillus sediminis TaxID=2018042 RepID=A0A2I0QT60_9BACI|nr:tryptophan synthase subunit alpha [Halalkalibacillus sediminis]